MFSRSVKAVADANQCNGTTVGSLVTAHVDTDTPGSLRGQYGVARRHLRPCVEKIRHKRETTTQFDECCKLYVKLAITREKSFSLQIHQ